ncbi:hypothetical protein [Candidatus Frankia alpina]|nr:hypothetical protein [Candidatus Frankia alpina]
MHAIGHGRDGGKLSSQQYTEPAPAVATPPAGRSRDGGATG